MEGEATTFFFILFVSAAIIGAMDEDIGCFRHGECRLSSVFNITRDVADSDACSGTCSDTMGCKFFTFHPDIGDCFLFETCHDLSYNGCPECISGEVGCSCFMKARCNGPLIDTIPTDDENVCLDACVANASCLSFTFDTASKNCIQLLNCQEHFPQDTDFISGWTGCTGGPPTPGDAPRYAMIIGGDQAIGNTDDVEIIDLMHPDTSCLKPADFPINNYGAVGAYIKGKVLVCGGSIGDDRCYEYSFETDSWELCDSSLIHSRDFASEIMLPSETFFVTGGNVGTELLYDEFVQGPPLPSGLEELAYHCAILVNETHAFIAGGTAVVDGNTDRAHLLDIRSWEWTELPDMPHVRYYTPACGAINGGKEVVMAGGWASPEENTSDSCDILDLEDFSWRTGPTLPTPLHGVASFPYGDTFMTFGGWDNSQPGSQEHVLRFDAANYAWIVLEQELALARSYLVAVPLPESVGVLCS